MAFLISHGAPPTMFVRLRFGVRESHTLKERYGSLRRVAPVQRTARDVDVVWIDRRCCLWCTMRSLVYSLEFELEMLKARTTHRLIVPINEDGRSPHWRAHERNKRLVDVGPGDWIVHNYRRYRVKTVAPFRSREITSDFVGPRHGFIREA
jgi:hypothetical protein